MILDKLVEKKDIILYINFRMEKLSKEFDINKYPIKERESQVERLNGRIKELKKLKDVINRNELKTKSKSMYRRINRAKSDTKNLNKGQFIGDYICEGD